jgi:hypothetical protein
VTSINLSKSTLRSNPQVQTTIIFNDLSTPNFILGEFGGFEKPVGQFRPNVQYQLSTSSCITKKLIAMGRSKSPKNGTTLRVSHFHNTTNTCNQPTLTMVPEPRLASKHRRLHTQNNPYIPMQQHDVLRFFVCVPNGIHAIRCCLPVVRHGATNNGR